MVKTCPKLDRTFQEEPVVKNLPANAGDLRDVGLFDLWVGKISWRKAWQLAPVFLPRESNGQRSLADSYPKGHKELETTEAT